MTYQSTKGLSWQGIGYGRQPFAIWGGNSELGAVTQTQIYDYTARAKELAAGVPGNLVFVGLGPNGSNAKVVQPATLDEVETLYEQAATDPGKFGFVYAAYFRKDQTADPYQEGHFTGVKVVETWFTSQKLKQLAPWIVGSALLIAGAIYYSKKKKGAPRHRARAGRSSRWRRRTVTVWR